MAAALIDKLRVSTPIAGLAAFFATELCLVTGLITGWGEWYSHDLTYRRQTEALLRGQAALSHEATGLEFDMAWAEGGVQQVWGLGVPLWRLPFEVLARAIGQAAFPDRLVLALAVFLAGYALLWALVPSASSRTARHWLSSAALHAEGIAAAAVLMLFPPVLAQCSGPFNRYEEPVVYGYYVAIALFALTIAFVRIGGLAIYALIGILGGFLGFIRPTMAIYGLASIVLSFLWTRRMNWSWRRSGFGPGLFLVGGLALYGSNLVRFGAGAEFGHNLNATGDDIMFASRFGSPFDDQPLWARGRELLGAIFFVEKLNGAATFDRDVVRWQMPVTRWRHFSSRTFDASYLVLLLVCWSWAAALLLRKPKATLQSTPPIALAAAWSLLGTLPLAAFYVRYYSISSRYMIDFAPAIGVAVVGVVLQFHQAARASRRSTMLRAGALALVAAWWTTEFLWADNLIPETRPWGQARVVAHMRTRASKPTVLPDHYRVGEKPGPEESNVLYNGFGWDERTGQTRAMAVFFVEDAANVRLEVEPAEGELLNERSLGHIRAKIGLEFLPRQSIEQTDRGWRITFAKPKRAAYRHSVQVLFVAFVPPNDFLKEYSPFRLVRVDWKRF